MRLTRTNASIFICFIMGFSYICVKIIATMSIKTFHRFKGKVRVAFLCILFAFCSVQNASATMYVAGGEIYYTYLGGNTYKFYLVIYQNCGGIPINLANFKISDGKVTRSYSDTLCCTSYYNTGIPSGQCSRCSNSSCAFLYGYQFRTYFATVDLISFQGCNFTISFTDSALSGGITTGGAGLGM